MHPLSLLRLIGHVGVTTWWCRRLRWPGWRSGPGRRPVTAVLRAHLAIKSDLVLALAVDVLNLIPGTMVLEIDQTRRIDLRPRHSTSVSDRPVEPVLPPGRRGGAAA